MSAQTATAPGAISGNRGRADRYGDRALLGITALASLLVVAVIAFIIYQLIDGASLALSTFGIAFVGHNIWNPVLNNQIGVFGAAPIARNCPRGGRGLGGHAHRLAARLGPGEDSALSFTRRSHPGHTLLTTGR